VPDGREQDAAVSPIRGEHGHDRQGEEVRELGEWEVAPQARILA
jgi:hypothetical protein